MFFPTRYKDFAIYDIKLLLSCETEFEERLFVNATKLIPELFGVGKAWGEEFTPSCIWIPEGLHDITYKKIRELLRSDQAFLINVITEIRGSIQVAQTIVSSSSDQEVIEKVGLLYSQIIKAVSCFSCNWLHPIPAIRQTLIRLFGVEETTEAFEWLLAANYQSKYLSKSRFNKDITSTVFDLGSNSENNMQYELQNRMKRFLNKDAANLFSIQIEFLKLLPEEEEYRRLMITRINEAILNSGGSLSLNSSVFNL
jgi:hypothetical protein